MTYLEKKLKEKAYAMFAERSITELSHPDDFRLILESGAALQREVDFIEEIRDAYCIDEHKDAEEMRDALVKAAAERKLKKQRAPRYKCSLCGTETETQRENTEYVVFRRCPDVCCDGPMRIIPPSNEIPL